MAKLKKVEKNKAVQKTVKNTTVKNAAEKKSGFQMTSLPSSTVA